MRIASQHNDGMQQGIALHVTKANSGSSEMPW